MTSTIPRSTSRTFLVVVTLVLAAVVLFMSGFVVWPRLGGMHSWGLFAPMGLMSLLNLALAIWVGIDAERRSGQGILWGLLVFFTSIIGLIVYLLVGPVTERQRATGVSEGVVCPACRGATQPGFKICPYCGERLENTCPGCGRSVRRDWRLCPECGANLRG